MALTTFRQLPKARAKKPRPAAPEDVSAKSAVDPVLPKLRVNGTEDFLSNCQKSGRRSPGLRHRRTFRQLSAEGPVLAKLRANGTGGLLGNCQKPGRMAPCARAYGRKVVKRLDFRQRRVYGAALRCLKPGCSVAVAPKNLSCQKSFCAESASKLFPSE